MANEGARPEVTAFGLTILFVAGSRPRLRATVAALRASGYFERILMAAQGERALRLASASAPDVVVLDSDTGSRPAAIVRLFVPAAPTAKIVVLTANDSDEAVLDMLRAGAAGVLAPDIATRALARALIGVATGEAAISRTCTTRLVRSTYEAVPRRAGMRPVRSSLTAREWEVLDLLASGSPEEAIARQLGVTAGTVRTHVRQLSRKLQTEAAQVAAARGSEPGGAPDLSR